MVFSRIAAVALLGSIIAAGPAVAEPVLQLYIEGASYDEGSESWLHEGSDIRLWVIGKTTPSVVLRNVRLAVGYRAAGDVTIDFVPATTEAFGGFADPSTPEIPTLLGGVHTNGKPPVITAKKSLAKHGYYDESVYWQEFALGDFTLGDSPIADFAHGAPAPHPTHTGQINVYAVAVQGLTAGGMVHFDAYGIEDNGKKQSAAFAPFSHDAFWNYVSLPPPPPEVDPSLELIPAPGAIGLFAAGVLVLGAGARRRPRRR